MHPGYFYTFFRVEIFERFKSQNYKMYHNFMSVNVMSFKTGYEDSVGHKVSIGLSVHREAWSRGCHVSRMDGPAL